jgi:hypothetical protein
MMEVSMSTYRLSLLATGFAIATTAATLLTVSPAMAASKGSITKIENSLSAAGFEARPANTPKRQAMLVKLPADKFAMRTKADTIFYVYPDPKVCNCIYVGDQQAYGAYQKAVAAKKIADEQSLSAAEYNDPAWDWGAWGPWGHRFGHFGFGRRGW